MCRWYQKYHRRPISETSEFEETGNALVSICHHGHAWLITMGGAVRNSTKITNVMCEA